MIFHGQNDFIRAAEYFSRVINEKTVDSMTRLHAANNAAVAYQKTSSWLDAARMYTLIINEYPDQIHLSSYHLKCGFCFVQASRNEEALAHFNEANIDPNKEDKPEIIYWIATCYSKMGDHTKAIAEYLKVPYLYSGIGKWGVTAEFEAARLYERQGEYDKAVTLYKKIIRSDGEQGRFGKNALARIQQLNLLTGDKNE
jgi:tetratricopeptide (TPR) repeat protein